MVQIGLDKVSGVLLFFQCVWLRRINEVNYMHYGVTKAFLFWYFMYTV